MEADQAVVATFAASLSSLASSPRDTTLPPTTARASDLAQLEQWLDAIESDPDAAQARRAMATRFASTSQTLHETLRRHAPLLEQVERSTSSSIDTTDLAFLTSVISYARKISYSTYPGWHVPGQLGVGEKQSWAPFAAAMSSSLLHQVSQREEERLAQVSSERAARIHAKLSAAAAARRGDGEMLAAAPPSAPGLPQALAAKAVAVPGGMMIDGIFIPAMPADWRPGDAVLPSPITATAAATATATAVAMQPVAKRPRVATVVTDGTEPSSDAAPVRAGSTKTDNIDFILNPEFEEMDEYSEYSESDED